MMTEPSPFPFNHGADIRYVTPTLKFTTRPYRLWLERIGTSDPYLTSKLDWIERVNAALFRKFDGLYDGDAPVITDSIGILAYGSLMSDPGDEIAAATIRIIGNVETPFPIEFARTSGKRRGGAPTLVPVSSGGRKVRGQIILVDASREAATDMLYRREIQEVGSGKRYKEPPADAKNRVRVKAVGGPFETVQTVLYTDLEANIDDLTADRLATLAIESVAKAETGKDGISYLIAAQANGLRTALSDEYAKQILSITGAPSLEEALRSFRV